MRTNKLLVECPRCAQQQEVERAGRYPDWLFLEVWQERFQLEAALRQAEARLESEKNESAWWREQHTRAMEHLAALAALALEQAKEAETI